MSIPARTSMEWEPALFLLAACLFAALLIPAEAQAATLHVRQDSGSSLILIQQAINQSTNGDVIIVAAGTYVENIDFMGKNITLTSESGPAATIIDGSSRDSSVVVFKRGETRSATIEGFTITGGRGSKPFGPLSEKGGGGIFALNSSPTIQNNTILGNSAIRPDAGARVTGTGGGIACGGEEREFLSAPLIQGNTIRQNQAGANGGGIAACGWASPTIVDNLVEQNSTVYGDGGGVYLLTLAEGALINSNLIISNSAGDHGGGVYGAVPSNLFTVSCEISRNLIWRNRAEAEARTGDSGGGYGWQPLRQLFEITRSSETKEWARTAPGEVELSLLPPARQLSNETSSLIRKMVVEFAAAVCQRPESRTISSGTMAAVRSMANAVS